MAPGTHDGHRLRDVFVAYDLLKTMGIVSAGKRGHRSRSEGGYTTGAPSLYSLTRYMAGGYNIELEASPGLARSLVVLVALFSS